MTVFDRLDATLKLNDEERMPVDSVRQRRRETIATRAQHYDRTGEFPHDNVKDINNLGLNAMFIPEVYGGAQMSYAAYLECVRQISAACASTGIIWATNFHAIKPLIEYGGHASKQRFLPAVAEGALASLAITEPG